MPPSAAVWYPVALAPATRPAPRPTRESCATTVIYPVELVSPAGTGLHPATAWQRTANCHRLMMQGRRLRRTAQNPQCQRRAMLNSPDCLRTGRLERNRCWYHRRCSKSRSYHHHLLRHLLQYYNRVTELTCAHSLQHILPQHYNEICTARQTCYLLTMRKRKWK